MAPKPDKIPAYRSPTGIYLNGDTLEVSEHRLKIDLSPLTQRGTVFNLDCVTVLNALAIDQVSNYMADHCESNPGRGINVTGLTVTMENALRKAFTRRGMNLGARQSGEHFGARIIDDRNTRF
ncbi:hypothetical protein [Aeromonas dhakensis]|uniref:hypothetical protein n=1 Tax=Aeromonas dhakensis TaxID=196024 RepID=UPI0005AB0306|nr:hypothetical protein [Aeromonas dhakensis]